MKHSNSSQCEVNKFLVIHVMRNSRNATERGAISGWF